MIGIILYSKTGETRKIALRLKEKLDCPLHEIIPESYDPKILKPVLIEAPEIGAFDTVILGSPVHGFQVAKVMREYLLQKDFTGKTVDLLITHYFPFKWLGGSQALREMKSIVEKKGGIIRHQTSINWSSKKRETSVLEMLELYS